MFLVSSVVDKKERGTGNNPEKELVDAGFQDYQRPYVIDFVLYQTEYTDKYIASRHHRHHSHHLVTDITSYVSSFYTHS